MKDIDKLLSKVDEESDDSINILFDLLKIKSISTQTDFKDECKKAAEWIRDYLIQIGQIK